MNAAEKPRALLDAAEHECYAILYEDKDYYYYYESEIHIFGDDSLDMHLREAHRLKSEGHRNVRVIEYVRVMREVASV